MKTTSGKEKTFYKIALILEAVAVAIGVVFLIKSGMSHTGATGGGVTRASTSIAFGADFYTTSAQYTGLAANAVVDLYKGLIAAVGCFFVLSGLISGFLTLGKIAGSIAENNNSPAVEADEPTTSVSQSETQGEEQDESVTSE